MVGFTGNYQHRPGDHFIFEGGVTWPNAAFPLAVTGSGIAGKGDYYGTDDSWFVGPRFTRPVFSAQNSPIVGPDLNGANNERLGGENDVFVDLNGHDYITVDDIAFTGFDADSRKHTYSYANCAVINADGNGDGADQHIVIKRIFVTSVYVDQASATSGCFAVAAYTNPPYGGSSLIEDSVIAGGGQSYLGGVRCFGNIEDNDIHDMPWLILPCGHGEIASNNLYDCGVPAFPTEGGPPSSFHADAFQVNGADGKFYIHDNVIHDTAFNSTESAECEAMLLGNPGETDYVWNNVLYGIGGNSIGLTQASAPGVAAYFWNNSIEGGLSGREPCVRSERAGRYSAVEVVNNLCITTDGVLTAGLDADRLGIGHNLTLSPAHATESGLGAGLPYVFSPQRNEAAVPNAGQNLSGLCVGPLRQLCHDTTYAGRRAARPRPRSGSWSVGAYER